MMDVNGEKTDNLKARNDMALYCSHPNLELKELHDGKIVMPKATFTLTKEQRKLIFEWVTNLQLLDGYCLNLFECVDLKEYQLSRMKSHDCHVFMERILPVAFRELLLEPI